MAERTFWLFLVEISVTRAASFVSFFFDAAAILSSLLMDRARALRASSSALTIALSALFLFLLDSFLTSDEVSVRFLVAAVLSLLSSAPLEGDGGFHSAIDAGGAAFSWRRMSCRRMGG